MIEFSQPANHEHMELFEDETGALLRSTLDSWLDAEPLTARQAAARLLRFYDYDRKQGPWWRVQSEPITEEDGWRMRMPPDEPRASRK